MWLQFKKKLKKGVKRFVQKGRKVNEVRILFRKEILSWLEGRRRLPIVGRCLRDLTIK